MRAPATDKEGATFNSRQSHSRYE